MRLASYSLWAIAIVGVLILLSACTQRIEPAKSLQSQYAFANCEKVGQYVARCENEEVVCYVSTYGASTPFCRFK